MDAGLSPPATARAAAVRLTVLAADASHVQPTAWMRNARIGITLRNVAGRWNGLAALLAAPRMYCHEQRGFHHARDP